jgi:hypothetical protein
MSAGHRAARGSRYEAKRAFEAGMGMKKMDLAAIKTAKPRERPFGG